MPKKWWKSKTIWVNAAFAAGTVLEANVGVIRDSVGPETYLLIIGAFAAVNAVLRFLTSQPVGK